MRFIPKDQDACLLLSAMREARAADAGERPADAEATMAAVTAFLLRREEDPATSPASDVEQAARAFLAWWAAELDDDRDAAAAAQAELDAVTAGSPFPWAGAKARFAGFLAETTCEYRTWTRLSDGVIAATIPDTATVAIIGDWGTGDADAQALLAHLQPHAPDVILHLGDIYESGTWQECQDNFLRPFDAVFPAGGRRPPVLTIPGNHEYFSGGHGYYRLIDTLNRWCTPPDWTQGFSFFCLRTAGGAWQFLAGDTGYASVAYGESVDPRLRNRELTWHQDKLDHFTGRTVFMTHHQFASADGALNPDAAGDLKHVNKRLLDQLKDDLPKISLWLWGHDHYFLAYRPDLPIAPGRVLKLGQLLGGSAREATGRSITWPAALQQRGGKPIVPDTSANLDGGKRLRNHTYAIMKLDPAPGGTTISYYQVHAWCGDRDADPGRPANPLHVATL